ncbi:MAG TPA: hypothetical protein VHW74_11530 [Mycobacteriales bacterium]|jgi:hypothetical protein|nr:hypothetical protein [Mycobacteriales bacterium]
MHGRPTALDAKGIEPLRFGADEASAEETLMRWFGVPTHALQPVHLPPACGYDRASSWPALTAYFFRGRFVGYLYRGSQSAPELAGPRGIRVGVPLARAAALGGVEFHRSAAEGGSWVLLTPAGKVGGLLTAVPPKGNIETIDGGSLGCQMLVL